ncbi:MAG: potassium transporter Kup [Burkholderiaceae bacterium]|nr:potassium transporter Kup [Burkholderiaceae bacterium]MBP6814130.1 potassium transporter Kup [Burkholderiaceae bacterium]MBP7659618.1 potassium transporter Kup [Burkholderiaceae bacterium]
MTVSSESKGLGSITLAAIGVVYGDIGTSPLYAFREAFGGKHGIPLTADNVFAVLSMMFWAVTIIVSLKYVVLMLRFDNQGEGGVLALLSWAANTVRHKPALLWLVTVMGAFSASLFYGDAVITPAISVLSAVEGITVAVPGAEHFVVPLALAVLIGLFAIQRRGTAVVGAFFGPIMIAWFVSLSALGLASIVQTPQILMAINPVHALRFMLEHPGWAFLASAAVFLCLTGAEALYADMGHFGPKPVRLAWFGLVFPALMINYLGQGALLLRDPEAARNPFYLLAPDWMLVPLIGLAMAATVIASQAVISGAFSATQQASRLNFLPRLQVKHTSDTARGQVYIPLVNWSLLVLVILLVLGFQNSDRLAAAYGIAVAGDLFLSSVILLVALTFTTGARRALWPIFLVLAVLEFYFFASNASKIMDGGWFPLALAAIVFTVLTTWRRGIDILRAKKEAGADTLEDGLTLPLDGVPRVPGHAVFFSSSRTGCPGAFLHNLKHNHVVHETTVFLTVEFDDVPRVMDDERVEIQRGANGIARVIAHFGFREDPDIELVLRLAARKGLTLQVQSTSFFTSKPTVVSVSRRGIFGWRRSLFGWMLQNSASVASYFNLPPNRVVELGAQVGI